MAVTSFSGPVVSVAGFQTVGGVGVSTFQTMTPTGAPSAGLYSGAGAPAFVAPQGSLYLNTTGNSVSTRAYINMTGSTTWTAITTAA